MVKVRYVGKRPFLLAGFYIHNDESLTVSDEMGKSLLDNPNFIIAGLPVYETGTVAHVTEVVTISAPSTPSVGVPTSPPNGEERPNLGEKTTRVVKRGKKK